MTAFQVPISSLLAHTKLPITGPAGIPRAILAHCRVVNFLQPCTNSFGVTVTSTVTVSGYPARASSSTLTIRASRLSAAPSCDFPRRRLACK